MLLAEGLPVQFVAAGVGAVIAGTLCGLWPLSAGARSGRPGLGVLAFVMCLISGFILGCLLALPTAIFFRVLIAALGHPAPPPGSGESLGGRPFDPYANGKGSQW